MSHCFCAYCKLMHWGAGFEHERIIELMAGADHAGEFTCSTVQNQEHTPEGTAPGTMAAFGERQKQGKEKAQTRKIGLRRPGAWRWLLRGPGLKSLALIPSLIGRLWLFLTVALSFAVVVQAQQMTTTPQTKMETSPTGILATEVADAKVASGALILGTSRNQPLTIPLLEKPLTIDGQIKGEEWGKAAQIKELIQIKPGENVQPSNRTEVFVAYDAKYLYVAFRAYDERDKIRATLPKRDSITKDDLVGLILDTFHDQRRAYILAFNPLGVQQDGVYTEDRGVDYSVDIVMQSKGRVIDEGYEVEVAIPFKSLRYEIGKGKFWGAHFFRETRRLNNEVDSWMPIIRGKSGLLNQAGKLAGFEGISSERTLEIIPSLTFQEEGKRIKTIPTSVIQQNPSMIDPGKFLNRPIAYDPGITMKLGISSSAALTLAINPDFAQVEADQPVVTANQRFPIFFEERRPFFLEGIEVFKTALTVVNTRTIIDPDYAVKLTGKRGADSYGVLLASDNAPGNYSPEERNDLELRSKIQPFLDKNSYVGVVRYKRDIGSDSGLGLIATTYNFINKHNNVGGLDGRFRLNQNTIFEFQAVGTTSRATFYDPDLARSLYRTGNGFGYNYSLERSGRNWGYELSGQGRTRDYRTDVGFIKRNNTNNEKLAIRYNSNPDPKAKIIYWRLSNTLSPNFDWQGRMQLWENSTRMVLGFRRQTIVSLAVRKGYERVFEEEFGAKRTATRKGAFAGPESERSSNQKGITMTAETTPNQKYSFAAALNYNWGALDYDLGGGPRFRRASPAALVDPRAPLDPGPGTSLQAQLVATYQPTQSLRSSLSYIKSRLIRDDTGLLAYEDNIFTLRSTYQFTRFVSARTRIDYSTLNARIRGQFLVGWTPSPGTAFFVGYNDDLNYNGYNPFTRNYEPGFQRNGRSFFIKMSYLFQHGFKQ